MSRLVASLAQTANAANRAHDPAAISAVGEEVPDRRQAGFVDRRDHLVGQRIGGLEMGRPEHMAALGFFDAGEMRPVIRDRSDSSDN